MSISQTDNQEIARVENELYFSLAKSTPDYRTWLGRIVSRGTKESRNLIHEIVIAAKEVLEENP